MAARLGKEEQTQELLSRIREARLAFDPLERRELRDELGLRIALASVLRRSSNAVDVGANEGHVLDLIVALAPEGRHVAFEPIPELYESLVERFPSVDVHCSAVSDTAGSAQFTQVLDAPAFSGLRQRNDLPPEAQRVTQVSVPTERLDDVLTDGPAPALIKIDVEGAELGVMQGALETLRRHRPHVVFEHGAGGADLYGTRPTQVFDLLAAVELRIFDFDGNGPYSRDRFEATFIEPIWNFLAAPA